jgi:periplasmic protein CpxP/Spy
VGETPPHLKSWKSAVKRTKEGKDTMRKQGKFAVLFTIALALAAPAVLAQSGPATSGSAVERKAEGGRHGRHGHHRRGFGFAKLNLTDAQKAAMKQVRENHKATLSALREQMKAKHNELRQASSGGNFSEALATQKLAEMAPLKAKLMAEGFAMHQQVMNILTPEQKAQLSQMRAEWKAKRANHSDSQR